MSSFTYFVPCGCERHEGDHTACNTGCEEDGCAHPADLYVFTEDESLAESVVGGDDTPDEVIASSAKYALRMARAQYAYEKARLKLIIAEHS